ncbi:anoctamin [Gregarina niphandrodes]|uniref:Anoctamin n=1 Tax=Gregarina niphandrodes TaxID=110365 RepID=A0A023B6F0_GRENI|nr:anoctamin [Gregarina niphandrodes]EZG66408.1 anoctamin [Gregarina niphandrodes]|eukprot:XP_011134000.1 anoctamin [Gregarina niphandrodes]
MALASVLQSLLVVFFDLLWAWIVKRSYSNHSLCVKTVLFKSLNHFLPLFYSALVHPTEISPYETFQTQLIMQFGLIIVADVTEVAVPYLTLVYKRSSCRRAKPTAEAERLLSPSIPSGVQPQQPFRATVTPPGIGPIRFTAEEAEYLMGHYDETNLADDYLEAVIQFTHLLFFSPCCPVIALFTLLRHNIEIYTDKIKLCRLFKRSCLMYADDQIYTNILRIISILALPTSLSMLLYFDPVLTFKQKLITFIILEYMMVSVRLYFHFLR